MALKAEPLFEAVESLLGALARHRNRAQLDSRQGNRNPNVIPRLLKEYLKIAKRNSWPSWPAHLCWLSLAVIPLWFVAITCCKRNLERRSLSGFT